MGSQIAYGSHTFAEPLKGDGKNVIRSSSFRPIHRCLLIAVPCGG